MPRNGVTTADVPAVHQPRTGVGTTAKGRSAKGFWSLKADWGKVGMYALVILLTSLALYFAGFCVNYGPSMNYLGWGYWVDWGRTPQAGEVFRFVPADKPAWHRYLPLATWVKRCTAITSEGYVFEGDNTEWSLDQREFGRDVMAPVPASHISGTVWAAFHPRRVARWFTSLGRLENWVSITQGTSFQFKKTWWGWFGRNEKRWISSSDSLVAHGSGYAVLCNSGIIELSDDGGCRLLSGDGQRVVAVLPEPIRQDLAGRGRKVVVTEEKHCFILGQKSVWVLESKGDDFFPVIAAKPEGNALIAESGVWVWVVDIMAPTPVFLQKIGVYQLRKR